MSDKSNEKTDGLLEWLCINCGCHFHYNIDGCPECGSQEVVNPYAVNCE